MSADVDTRFKVLSYSSAQLKAVHDFIAKGNAHDRVLQRVAVAAFTKVFNEKLTPDELKGFEECVEQLAVTIRRNLK